MDEIIFNPNDYDSLIALMNNHKQYPVMLTGENEDGESIWISVCENFIKTQTFQHNDWIRINYYHRDGTTEEMYEY